MVKGRSITFFAIRSDIIRAMESIEICGYNRFKYVEMELFNDADIPIYNDLSSIPDLGKLRISRVTKNYLIFDREDVILPEKNSLSKYIYYPWSSGDSTKPVLKLSPGGLNFKKDKLLFGELSTCSDNEETKTVFNLYKNSIKRNFIKAPGGYWIGKKTLDLYYNKARFIRLNVDEELKSDFTFDM